MRHAPARGSAPTPSPGHQRRLRHEIHPRIQNSVHCPGGGGGVLFPIQGVRYLTNPYATTRVYTSTTEDAVEASGWLVREEETFRTDAGTLSPTREEGEKAAPGHRRHL